MRICKDNSDYHLNKPYIVEPLNAMSYFSNVAENIPSDQVNGPEFAWAYHRCFRLICDKRNELKALEEDRFSSIVESLVCGVDNFLPAILYAEMETKDRNIRMSIIPNSQKKKMYGLTVQFRRTRPPPTSSGVVDLILNSLPPKCNVWSINNRTERFDDHYEIGNTDFIIYDENIISNNIRESVIRETILKNAKEKIPQIPKWVVNCYTIEQSVINKSLDKSDIDSYDYRYDVFLSYSKNNSKEAEYIVDILSEAGFKCFLDKKSIHGGEFWDPTIREALLSSREIIMLYSQYAKESNWVTQEYGAAWVLDKPIIPVVLNMEMSELPDNLKQIQAFFYHDVTPQWIYIDQLRGRIKDSPNKLLKKGLAY